MSIARNKALWIGLAAVAGAAYAVGKSSHRRRRAPRPVVWSMDHPLGLLPHGRTLRIRLASPGVVHWTVNQWDDVQDVPTSESASNVHTVDLPTASLPPGTRLQFTFYWPKVRRWEVQDFEIQIEGAERGARAAGEAGAGYFRR